MGDNAALGGRYRLVERLGVGGMSIVWRGYDEILGRHVAVKVLTPDSAIDGAHRAGVYREAQATARLCHPHIAGVFDYGESIGPDGQPTPFIVMELVTGVSLADRLADGDWLPWPEATTICAQVGSALAEAHAHGVVHRDVKPANVMLTSTGAKVVDFGISATVGETDWEPDGQFLGTPAYVAPERLLEGRAGTATDVYALGLLLYRMLAGSLPWQASTVTQMLTAHRYVEPAPLPDYVDVPDELRLLCDRCLAKEPEDRPSSHELAAALAALGSSLGPAPVRLAAASPSLDVGESTVGLTPAELLTSYVAPPVLFDTSPLSVVALPGPGPARRGAGRLGRGGDQARRPVLAVAASLVLLLGLGAAASAPTPTAASASTPSVTGSSSQRPASATVVSNGCTPGGAVPVPPSSVPASSVPTSSVPDPSVPGSSVPGSSVPGSSVPGSSVPVVDAAPADGGRAPGTAPRPPGATGADPAGPAADPPPAADAGAGAGAGAEEPASPPAPGAEPVPPPVPQTGTRHASWVRSDGPVEGDAVPLEG